MVKVRGELSLYSAEEARALHLTSFLLSVLVLTIATSQSARGNFNSYCEIEIFNFSLNSCDCLFVVSHLTRFFGHQHHDTNTDRTFSIQQTSPDINESSGS